MRILALSSLVKFDDVRDSVTYNFVVRELETLAAAGHEVSFFINRNTLPSESSSFEYIGVPPHAKVKQRMAFLFMRYLWLFLPGFYFDRNRTYQILKTEAAIWTILSKQEFDVIHTHFLSPGGESCVLSAEYFGIPVVATLRGAELRDLPELDYGSMRSKCFSYMFGWAKNRITRFTVPNNELKQLLVTTHGVADKKIEVVFNGVSKLVNTSDRIPHTAIKIIAVGWFTKLKNHQLILNSLIDLNPESYELLLVGEGPLEGSYRSYIEQHGLKNVSLESNVPRTQLLEKIAKSDLLIHPSLYEGMPNVVLESLALGTPVAASRISAHESIVSPGYNGFLFDYETAEELQSLLQDVTGCSGKLERIRANCAKSSRDFSLDKKIESYLSIYSRAQAEVNANAH